MGNEAGTIVRFHRVCSFVDYLNGFIQGVADGMALVLPMPGPGAGNAQASLLCRAVGSLGIREAAHARVPGK